MIQVDKEISKKIRVNIFGISFTHMYIHLKMMQGIEQQEGVRHRLIINGDRWFDIHRTIKNTHRRT